MKKIRLNKKFYSFISVQTTIDLLSKEFKIELTQDDRYYDISISGEKGMDNVEYFFANLCLVNQK